jgi:hypothetical protein
MEEQAVGISLGDEAKANALLEKTVAKVRARIAATQ